jgi:hypothetical protein
MGIVILVGAQYKNTRKMGIKMKSKYKKMSAYAIFQTSFTLKMANKWLKIVN